MNETRRKIILTPRLIWQQNAGVRFHLAVSPALPCFLWIPKGQFHPWAPESGLHPLPSPTLQGLLQLLMEGGFSDQRKGKSGNGPCFWVTTWRGKGRHGGGMGVLCPLGPLLNPVPLQADPLIPRPSQPRCCCFELLWKKGASTPLVALLLLSCKDKEKV